TNTTVGGDVTDATKRNVISGNDGDGVVILGASATGNSVQGNYVGTNAAGLAVPNGQSNKSNGVTIDSAGGNLVGGAGNLGNVISGNGLHGVLLTGTTVANTVRGNLIGTDKTGGVALPNGSTTGNLGQGVFVAGSSNQVIGPGNVIAGNSLNGVRI